MLFGQAKHSDLWSYLDFNVAADVTLQRFAIDEMGGGDVLDRDADGFVKRYFVRAASSRSGAGRTSPISA